MPMPAPATAQGSTWDADATVPVTNPAKFLLDRVPHKPAGSGWVTLCPAHPDREASLSVGVGDDGRVLLHCHAGCALTDVLRGLRLAETDLFPDHAGRRITALHDYEASDYSLVRQVVRYHPKAFKQRRPDDSGGWIWNVEGVPDTLYALPRLRDKARVFIVEGEKDADRLWSLDLPATTNAGGAGKWREAHTGQLVMQNVGAVTILPDHDEPGRRHAEAVARACHAAGLRVRVLPLPGLPDKGDVSDWLDAGHTAQELATLANGAPTWVPPADEPAHATTSPDELPLTPLATLLTEPDETQSWLVEDLIPVGGLAILVGKPKAGKTVTAQNLAWAVARGEPFLGRPTRQGPVFYLALEEKRSEFKRRFRAMGATTEPILAVTAAVPREGLAKLRRAIERAPERPVLAIVDPLMKFIRLEDASNYSEVTVALEPLLTLARDTGVTIVALHHAGKVERSGGDEVLGSTAIFGAVDTLLGQRRWMGNAGVVKYRTLYSVQRYGNDLPESVLERDPVTGLLTLAGSRAAVDEGQVAATILAVLRAATGPLTEPELLDTVEGDTSRKRRTLRQLVPGQVTRLGRGTKGDPFRYTVPVHEVEQTRILESGPVSPSADPIHSFSTSRPRHREVENGESTESPRQNGRNARLGSFEPSVEHRNAPVEHPAAPAAQEDSYAA